MFTRVVRMTAAALCYGGTMQARTVEAQWSAAPSAAIGLAVPAGSLRDLVSEGVTAKAGLWMRAPRIPVGFTAEGMYSHSRAAPRSGAVDDFRVSAMTLNLTTRRHEGRLDPYGVLGAGRYWYNDPGMRFSTGSAPGVNIGLGEVIAVGTRDLFVEMRLHAIRTPTTDGARWTTLLPIMLGIRY